jgi:hypothetical protein
MVTVDYNLMAMMAMEYCCTATYFQVTMDSQQANKQAKSQCQLMVKNRRD